MMQAEAASHFSHVYSFAGANRQRVLLTALAFRRPLPSLPARPRVYGVDTQEELQQVLADLRETCMRLGYSLDDFVIEESGRFHAGYLTALAFPAC